MEDQQNAEIQLQQQQQNREGWREETLDKVEVERQWSASDIKMQKILGPHEHAKYSQTCVHRKRQLLGDLRTLFLKKTEGDKDGLGGIRKLIARKTRKIPCVGSAGRRRMVLEMMQKPDEVSDLVIAIQSPHFKITEKGNLNKTNGLLSAYRTDALTNGPVVQEVENGSILCDSHQVSGSVNHTVPIMDSSEQTLSMGQMQE